MSQTRLQASEEIPQWLKRSVAVFLAIIILVVVGYVFLLWLAETFAHTQQITCLHNLRVIQLEAALWADDHHTNRLPSDVLLLTNKLGRLGGPELLRCPADFHAQRISAWSGLTQSNISYVINVEDAFLDSTNIYVSCPTHQYAVTGNGKASHRYSFLRMKVISPK